MILTPAQREALLLLVAVGCSDPSTWYPTCTEGDLYIARVNGEDTTLVCDQLVELGLLCDIGGDFLALYRPTLAGVRLAIQQLQAFLAAPPQPERVLDD